MSDLYRKRRLKVELRGNITTDFNVARAILFTHSARSNFERISIGRVLCLQWSSGLAKVADQNHVARLSAARNYELPAVAREGEPEDFVGLKVG